MLFFLNNCIVSVLNVMCINLDIQCLVVLHITSSFFVVFFLFSFSSTETSLFSCIFLFLQNKWKLIGLFSVKIQFCLSSAFLYISVHIGVFFFAYKQIMNLFANRGMPFVIVENTQLQTWALRRQNVATATLEQWERPSMIVTLLCGCKPVFLFYLNEVVKSVAHIHVQFVMKHSAFICLTPRKTVSLAVKKNSKARMTASVLKQYPNT